MLRSTGARSYEPQIHVERARLPALLSEAAGRERWLREGHRLFIEMGAARHAERIAQRIAADSARAAGFRPGLALVATRGYFAVHESRRRERAQEPPERLPA